MPYIIRPRRGAALLRALLAACAIAGAVPSLAGAACASQATTGAFAQFGDQAAYTLAPGGSFEAGAPGWELSQAAVVEGNESYNLVPGSHSLALQPGGVAVSPYICMSGEYPSFRLFARRFAGSSSSVLYVSLRWVNVLGVSVNTSAGTVKSDGAWAPSPVLKLGNSLPLWLPGSSLDVQLVFQPSAGGSWAIDDVYIDPYSR